MVLVKPPLFNILADETQKDEGENIYSKGFKNRLLKTTYLYRWQ